MLFTFPSRYLFTIGRRVVFSLRRWSSWIPTGFHVSCGTRVLLAGAGSFAYRAVTVFGRPFQGRSARHRLDNPLAVVPDCLRSPTTPVQQRQHACTELVWAVPRSLAATGGIAFAFLSSGYLDVSVPRVRCRAAMDSPPGWQVVPARVVPFGDLRITTC